MKKQIMIQVTISEPEVFPNADSDDQSYKTCPYCGQNRIPFKLGVCICGKQVGKIQYVKNAEKFAKSQYYSYIGNSKVQKLGIPELTDN